MKTDLTAKLLTIFINSTDRWQGHPLYAAIVELCRRQGVSGVTVTRCVEGYGNSRQLHTTRLLELSENLPVKIEIVELAERVGPLLAALEPMIGEGLLTLADVQARRYEAGRD